MNLKETIFGLLALEKKGNKDNYFRIHNLGETISFNKKLLEFLKFEDKKECICIEFLIYEIKLENTFWNFYLLIFLIF